jgi:hypothetical protein
MNEQSSRSHAVVSIQISLTEQHPELNTITRTFRSEWSDSSKLSLVDLAGSERIKKSNLANDRLQEGANINKSLSTLGLVIQQLAKKQAAFVPYRDSTLTWYFLLITWLLKEALGGNSKTFLIATISRSMDNMEETLSTLRFALNAKKVQTVPIVNEDENSRVIKGTNGP